MVRRLSYLVPVVVVLGGLVMIVLSARARADENRSAGVFPGRIVAVGRSQTVDVDFAGPDGRTTTATVRPSKGLVTGSAVRVRVWPGEHRAALDHGVSHETTMAVGGVVVLLGLGGGVGTFVRHRRADASSR
ncbi:hypothetical protein ACIOD2_19860 [Amycolatopsis sp. NPDC088138]|uniref:hypothetical protein n=1 Tax=Amycolatopsis sp. NPDC088138 TaxID=3363938 RepID=UPI0038146709